MTALNIENLALNADLDKAAMSAVVGGGRVAYEFLGSTVGSMSAWSYTGRSTRRFIGNVYLSGKGWTRKYKTSYQYKRVQYKLNHFNEFYQ
ncbi:hypothetical protein [Thiosocius teredinicola]|uniref:hypothetical protein n=1 Tax=Thiosocius teredinicola TaxID=1973002 RepID=UPI0009911C26